MPAPMTTIGFEWTNAADWIVLFQANDDETGDLIDFTGAEIAVAIKDRVGAVRLSALVGSGIEIVETGTFELRFTAAQMAMLCQGSYAMAAFTGSTERRNAHGVDSSKARRYRGQS